MNCPQQINNVLLSAMQREDLAQIQNKLTFVELPLRQCLAPANEPIRHVYFIQSGIVSVVAKSDESRQIEVGLVGREGVSGLPLILGVGQSANQEYVQVAGTAFKMPAAELLGAVAALPAFRGLLLRYVHAFMTQVAQSMLAVGSDNIRPRLARWLLMCQDRVGDSLLSLTHEFLSVMLGVRRSGVTDSLNELEGEKLIKAGRGRIMILDRPGLVKAAGASYGVPEQEYKRLI
jgi:CRP-like cAMP-binding protein